MSQNLKGVDIYPCQFFELDSSGKMKFMKGRLCGRTPDSFKTLKEIKDVIRYCMWIVEQKDIPNVSKYAAIVYHNKVNERLVYIEREYRKYLRIDQMQAEANMNQSTDKPGRRYV